MSAEAYRKKSFGNLSVPPSVLVAFAVLIGVLAAIYFVTPQDTEQPANTNTFAFVVVDNDHFPAPAGAAKFSVVDVYDRDTITMDATNAPGGLKEWVFDDGGRNPTPLTGLGFKVTPEMVGKSAIITAVSNNGDKETIRINFRSKLGDFTSLIKKIFN